MAVRCELLSVSRLSAGRIAGVSRGALTVSAHLFLAFGKEGGRAGGDSGTTEDRKNNLMKRIPRGIYNLERSKGPIPNQIHLQ